MRKNIMGLGKMSEAGASLINGATGFLGGLVGNIFQRRNINKQIKAQARENQKNREYNLMLARMQNDWNLQQYEREVANNLAQWNRQNLYDSPAEQMKRFREAGLNASLIYSQFGGGTAMSLPSIAGSMTAGAPSSPQDMSSLGSLPTYGDTLTTAIDSAFKGAQISKLRADTQTEDVMRELKVAETSGRIELNGYQVKLNAYELQEMKPLEKRKLAAEISKLVNEADEIKARVDKIQKEISILDEEKKLKAVERIFAEEKAQYVKEYIAAELLGIQSNAYIANIKAKLDKRELDFVMANSDIIARIRRNELDLEDTRLANSKKWTLPSNKDDRPEFSLETSPQYILGFISYLSQFIGEKLTSIVPFLKGSK